MYENKIQTFSIILFSVMLKSIDVFILKRNLIYSFSLKHYFSNSTK